MRNYSKIIVKDDYFLKAIKCGSGAFKFFVAFGTFDLAVSLVFPIMIAIGP